MIGIWRGFLLVRFGLWFLLFIASVSASAAYGQTSNAPEAELTKVWNRIDDNAQKVVAISVPFDRFKKCDYLDGHISGERLAKFTDYVGQDTGSGVIISEDGFILTNEHVIEPAVKNQSQIWVTTDRGRVYPALLMGSDPKKDLAVLKIPGQHLLHEELSAQKVDLSSDVLALGNPRGRATAGGMTGGVGKILRRNYFLRAKDEDSSDGPRIYENIMQISAQVLPGQSGGGLFDEQNHLIGITTATLLDKKNSEKSLCAYALPITSELIDEVDGLKKGQVPGYAYLGVEVEEFQNSDYSRLDKNHEPYLGTRIKNVYPNTPAASVLDPGDLLLQINEKPVLADLNLTQLLEDAGTESPTTLLVVKNKTDELKTYSILLSRQRIPYEVHASNRFFRWGDDLYIEDSQGVELESDDLSHSKSSSPEVNLHAVSHLTELEDEIFHLPAESCNPIQISSNASQ